MRGRSLLWAGPGVMLLGGRGPRTEPLAAEPNAGAAGGAAGADPVELEISAAEDRIVPLPALGPAAGPAARGVASYAGSSVTKTKG